jgi:hypothetical protein
VPDPEYRSIVAGELGDNAGHALKGMSVTRSEANTLMVDLVHRRDRLERTILALERVCALGASQAVPEPLTAARAGFRAELAAVKAELRDPRRQGRRGETHGSNTPAYLQQGACDVPLDGLAWAAAADR